MAACRVTSQPSKVLPSCIYVVHMDPVCPKCMPTKATNLPVRQTCWHRSGPTRNTSSFADVYSMKMGSSYTAIALEVDYRLLCQHFQLPLCPGTTTVGALGCLARYLVSLFSPALQPDTACLLSAQRALRISHV